MVKREHNEDGCHLIHIAAETASGLKPRLWVGRMIESYKSKGVLNSPSPSRTRAQTYIHTSAL
jgi:hypothetical protein